MFACTLQCALCPRSEQRPSRWSICLVAKFVFGPSEREHHCAVIYCDTLGMYPFTRTCGWKRACACPSLPINHLNLTSCVSFY